MIEPVPSESAPSRNDGPDVTGNHTPALRVLDETLPYLDESEDELLSLIGAAADCTSGSDELAAHIHDWPTRYHLSRLRANLLRPLNIAAGARVLDVGAGTGALSRYLGEIGADVVALEGSIARAKVASARCRDLPNVEVIAGPLASYTDDDSFDLVLLCGVLEYSNTSVGGGRGPEELLARVRELTAPDGTLVVAIENQLGLKYLLGYAEDHLARPWVGVEGYPLPDRARTWTRRGLSDLVESAGFMHQNWLYPYPDYKLPSVVLADRTFDMPDAVRLLDQVLRDPVRDYAHPVPREADARRAHQTFIEGGLGREVSNSFLLLAGSNGQATATLTDPDILVWRYGEERRRRWLRSTIVREDKGSRVAHQRRLLTSDEPPAIDWLRQVVTPERPYFGGHTLEQQLLAASDARDLDQMGWVLERWRATLRSVERPRDESAEAHPFVTRSTTRVLPSDWLDASLDNFVDDGEEIHYIDDEWKVPGGVDVDMAVARALWWLARTIIDGGYDHPWRVSIDVDSLSMMLGQVIDEEIDTDLLLRVRDAEAQLQELLLGEPAAQIHTRLDDLGATSATLRGSDGDRAAALLGRVVQDAGDDRALWESERSRMSSEMEALDEHRKSVTAEFKVADRQRAQLQEEHADLAATLDRIRNRLAFRVYLKVRSLLGRDGEAL